MKNLNSISLLLIIGLSLQAMPFKNTLASELSPMTDVAQAPSIGAGPENTIFESLLEPLLLGETSKIAELSIISPYLTSHLYQKRQYLSLWNDKDYAASVIETIKGADDEGLFKEDYHYQDLISIYRAQALNEWQDPYKLAQFDILLTDAVITYGIHLINGKVNPDTLGKTWNYDEAVIKLGTVIKELNTHIQAQDVAERLSQFNPQLTPYYELKSALKHYRQLADNQTFTNIDYRGVVKAGKSSPMLPSIAQRLMLLNYLSPQADITHFSPAFVTAITSYQTAHSLNADGIIGQGTIDSLNVPFSRRVDQIRINMERARWLSADLTDEYIIINLAGYALWMFKDGQLDWQTDIIIGKINSKTPLFKSRISYLVVNPTWTVPRSINREIIAKIQRDPDYIEKKHFMLKESSGKAFNIDKIDWESVNPRAFKYWFVQKPWKNNALGQVKFIFPNRHAIYLHDTPTKQLFEHTDRAFSHGCIRVKNPMVLAEKLLARNNITSIDKALKIQNGKLAKPKQSPIPSSPADELLTQSIAMGETQKLYLDNPMEILIMYWTAASNDGELIFYHDVYKRDNKLIDLLKAPLITTTDVAAEERSFKL
ncbi:L,D-transpeptidase family protein [Shewanella sp.]|uniref:L,D-transpeptidase family protein n=1 Tax=Shewanella sp. TaxID=50422 RepID=UPI0025857556|nr:L,D-transpeptidase family protein [Shewanella sp.]MCJ8301295.1 L,D-transpeptidase family protein [Shewanella sp.]